MVVQLIITYQTAVSWAAIRRESPDAEPVPFVNGGENNTVLPFTVYRDVGTTLKHLVYPDGQIGLGWIMNNASAPHIGVVGQCVSAAFRGPLTHSCTGMSLTASLPTLTFSRRIDMAASGRSHS